MIPDNVLHARIEEFLVKYPPFSLMRGENLRLILDRIRVRYVDKGDIIYRQGETTHEYFYMIRRGAVRLERTEGATNILLDIYDEGDVFGIRPVIADQPYLSTSIAHEETILFLISADDMRRVMQNNSKVAYFLASSFASGAHGKVQSEEGEGVVLISSEGVFREKELYEVQTIQHVRQPVTCEPDTTIEEAARTMTREEVRSIVVTDERNHPLGIMTDSDLRKFVGAGNFDPQKLVKDVMHQPVISLPRGTSYADTQIVMIQHGINQIVITEDGTENTPVVGVFSESEMLAYQGNSPGMIIEQMKKKDRPESLKKIRDRADFLLEKYLSQDVSARFISDVMTAINDALYVKAIQIAKEEIRKEKGIIQPALFCWVAIGSHGRREQIVRTDQDHAIIFADVPQEKYEEVKNYFLDVAERVVRIMEICGFSRCPADMMADNPNWCMSLEEWKNQFSKWIMSPNNESILHSNIFMDYRAVYGEVEFTKDLTAHIMKMVHENRIFLTYLAKYAASTPPPLSFFRNFILEKDGAHKDQFDIKQRGMLPLVDAARVLVLDQKVEQMNNTIQRFRKLAEVELKNAEMYQDAEVAYEILMKLRAQNGIRNSNSGRFISPDDLNKMQRLLLRNSFKPIEELQEVLRVRFQLNFF